VAELRIRGVGGGPSEPRPSQAPTKAFGDVLSLALSSHAKKRIGGTLSAQQASLLETAIDALAAKGARESVVVLPDEAYLVSVKNRTVITRFEAERLQGTVIQGVDSIYIAARTVGPQGGKPGTADGQKRSTP
jgi:flagellar operon protein